MTNNELTPIILKKIILLYILASRNNVNFYISDNQIMTKKIINIEFSIKWNTGENN